MGRLYRTNHRRKREESAKSEENGEEQGKFRIWLHTPDPSKGPKRREKKKALHSLL